MAKAHTSHAAEVAEQEPFGRFYDGREGISVLKPWQRYRFQLICYFGVMVRLVGRKPDSGSGVIIVINTHGRRRCEGIVHRFSPYTSRKTC